MTDNQSAAQKLLEEIRNPTVAEVEYCLREVAKKSGYLVAMGILQKAGPCHGFSDLHEDMRANVIRACRRSLDS